MRRCTAAAFVLVLSFAPVQAQALLKPTNLTAVNTSKDEDDPHPSADRLRLYYTSNADGPLTLLLTRRSAVARPWEAGKPLSGPGEGDARSPFLTADGHDLYFAAKIAVRGGDPDAKPQPANFDLVHSIRLTRPDEFTGPTPLHALCSADDETHPCLTAGGKELYFSRKTKDGWRLLAAKRPAAKGAFGEPKLVEEFPAGYHRSSLSGDGRTMYLQGPLDGGRWGLFRATRGAAGWGKPEPLDFLNSPEAPTGDTSPGLSPDGRWLYFSSDRPGGKGGRDLWVIDTSLFNRVK
jgi:hypothetical protein